jgi:hypothetical protein
MIQDIFNKEKEIAGGVPVNEKNILVKKWTRKTITTQAGVLHYNMKWLSIQMVFQKNKPI